MAIEDATQRLKDQNESGLDRRLLLPSVAVSESQKSEDDTKVNTTQIVKAVTGIGVSINDKNDLIIDALMEINQSILGLSQGSGLGNAENTLQTILRAPGRAARSVGRTARRGFETIRDFALAPLNLAIGTGKSIVRGAGSALMAGPRAIGGAVGNLFQSKSMKALVDINQKALDETTAIKESNEDIAVKVEEIAKMLSYEFKLRRQSRLDELEKERDSRNQQGVVVPPVQREIVEANDDGSTTKGILSTLATILGAKFVGGKVVAGAAAVAAASSLATRKVIKGNAKGGDVLDLEESKRNQNDTSNNNQNKDNQKRTTGSKLSKFAKAGGIFTGLVTVLTGILDKPMEDQGYSVTDRIGANAVEGGLGLMDLTVEGTNQILDTLIPEEIFGLDFRAKDPGTSEAFRERVLKNNSIAEVMESFIFPNAKAKREKEYLDNFTGGEEMDFLQMGEFIPPPDLLSSQQQKQIDETKKKMLDLEPMSVSESVKNMMALEPMVNSFSGGIYEAVIKRDNQIPVIELNVTPGSNINDLLEQQLENLNLSNDKGMGSMVMPISDNSVKNSTSNNTTVLNKMPLSTVDTNKVVPI